jgi:hypothetical protein
MRKRIICLIVILLFCTEGLLAIDSGKAQIFGADDLHLRGGTVTSYQVSGGEHILVFNDGFDLVIGDNKLKSNQAVVWINSVTTDDRGVKYVEHNVTVYLQDKVTVEAGLGSKTSGVDMSRPIMEGAESLVTKFQVAGEIFATAEKRITEDPRTSLIYHNALVATHQIELPPEEKAAIVQQQPAAPNIFEKVFGTDTTGRKGQPQQPAAPAVPAAAAPKFQYPVNISSATDKPVRITNENLADGTNIATVLNRFYLWQKQDESGRLLEFQADSAVIFYAGKTSDPNKNKDLLPVDNTVKAVYLRGDIVMTEGSRTIRADEVYYDFQKKQALVINAVMRTFDPSRGIPVYARAAKLKQVSENKFAGSNVTLTSSEFYVPKISATASEIYIADSTVVDQQTDQLGNQSYDVMMKDVKLKVDNRTVFYWPKLSGDFERPDIPIRRVQFARDNTFGTSIETEWFLARVLGLRELPGVDSSLMYDYYSKRGTGIGGAIKYERDTYFGHIDGYVINDRGKDDLGRDRQNDKPEDKLRGMVDFQHRQFLPYHWQLTLESSYQSDENYLESFRRSEFMNGKERETLIHLKWLKDNQAFAILGKWRINDFADQLEELPSAQYHLKGQSLFSDKFTLYSDSSVGRFRQRTGKDHGLNISNEYFTFGSTRTEIDMPVKFASGNIVPYIAGTFGYDDRSGFDRGITTGTGSNFGQQNVFIGEAGVRTSTQYWRTYPNIQSKFWDIDGIRHIIKPYANAAIFAESDDVVEQKDTYTLGVLQRWQTKRGQGEKRRSLDWMRLKMEYTMVSNDNSDIDRPDNALWNNPLIPLSVLSVPAISNGDLAGYRRFQLFGPQKDSFNADYIWRLSDTTAILSDLNYGTKDNELEQFNIGLSRLVWPNLSYYIGMRYLKNVQNEDENGSNAFTFAMTYKLNPRYMISMAHQYDFKTKKRITSQVSLIRRYHRLYYGLTYSIDESLDRRAIVLNIWPEGVGELGFGSKTFMGLDSPTDRNY